MRTPHKCAHRRHSVPALIRNTACAFATTMIVGFAALSPAFADNISGGEIHSMMIGKQLKFKTSNGTTGTTFYNQSGTGNVKIDSGFTDTGKWRIDGNQLCVTWTKIREGKEGCLTYQKMGETLLQSSNGIRAWY